MILKFINCLLINSNILHFYFLRSAWRYCTSRYWHETISCGDEIVHVHLMNMFSTLSNIISTLFIISVLLNISAYTLMI